MRKPAIRKVAVAYPPSVTWMARCMDGVRRYAREKAHWHLLSSSPALRGVEGSVSLNDLRGWNGNGILALIDDERELRLAAKLKIPVVNLGARLPLTRGIPRVMVNNRTCGKIAADHLLERGLRNLAFFGWKDAWYSTERRDAFRERATKNGATCAVLLRHAPTELAKKWTQRFAEVRHWLAALPKPCGVFAVHDYMAQLVMEACHEAGLRIPEDVAVMGMDNDTSLCDHALPPLTSIARNADRVGWEAASLLDRLMQGKTPPRGEKFVEPEGIVARQSTNMLYCGDPVVQRALDHFRENLTAQFNVADLAEKVFVSKRTLEMRFREHLHASPHEFLTRLRVKHAQKLLELPQKRTITRISVESGFATTQTFYAAFQRITGHPLAAYRRKTHRQA